MQSVRWRVTTAMDIATEIIGCFLPCALVWDLKMPPRIKFHIVMAFILRLPLIALAVVHLHSVYTFQDSRMPSLAASENLFWLQTMVTWSLVSATVPNLRGLLKSFDTQFGMGMPRVQSGRGQNDAYPLVTIGGSSSRSKKAGTIVSPRIGHTSRDTSGYEDHRRESSQQPSITQPTVNEEHSSSASIMEGDGIQALSRNGSQEHILQQQTGRRSAPDA